MITLEEFERLLHYRPEERPIDFKAQVYDFKNKKDKADGDFLKDLICFANTVRTETAYLIFGVELHADGSRDFLGVSDMPDDASLQQKASSKITPVPQFSSYYFPYDGKQYGIIEIPVHRYAYSLRITVKGYSLDFNKTYIRRGTSNEIASSDEIIHLYEWLKSLQKESLPEPNIYPLPEEYLERTVSSANSSPYDRLFMEQQSLEPIAKKHKRIALLGWGLAGKSTELKQLAAKLSAERNNHVFLIPFENHLDGPIEDRIPAIDRIPPEKLIVLLDGLDEIMAIHFEAVRRLISQFAEKYPQATIVVSCRTNFYTTDTDEIGVSTLSEFEVYSLNPLSENAIQDYLQRTIPPEKEHFLIEVRRKQLQELLRTPYYLVKLVRQYSLEHTIAKSKAELFEKDIRELIRKQIDKIHHRAPKKLEEQLFRLFEKLAFIMEAQGTNLITTQALQEIFPEEEDFQKVCDCAAILHGSPSREKTWKFNHNNTQEYLAAQVLSRMTFKEIRKTIGVAPDYKRIKPSWVNTLSFLNSILAPQSVLKAKITHWLVTDNLELVVALEPEKVDKVLRYKAFVSIYNKYKIKKRHINRNIFHPENLAKIAEDAGVFKFLLKELQNESHPKILSNALEIINYFPLKIYPKYQAAFKPYYKQFLLGTDTALHFIALAGYTTNFSLTLEEFNEVFEKFKDHEDTWIRYHLFAAIWMTGHQDRLIHYLVYQARFLIEEDSLSINSHRKPERLGNEKYELIQCFKKLNTAQGLTLFFKETKKDFPAFAYEYQDECKVILQQATSYPHDIDLKEAIRSLFLQHHTYLLENSHLGNDFHQYFQDTDQVNAVLHSLYTQFAQGEHSALYSMARLTTPIFIDFLHQEFTEGRLTTTSPQRIGQYMENIGNTHFPYFRKTFELAEEQSFSQRNIEQERKVIEQRNLAALFDKNILIAEIEKIFQAFGRDKLTSDDRYSGTPKLYSTDFIEVARDYVDIRQNSVTREQALTYATEKFDQTLASRVHRFLLRYPAALLTETQIAQLKAWCDDKAATIDFRQAIVNSQDNRWSQNKTAVRLSFFIRYFNLHDYPETLYLDMLSFLRHSDNLIDIIPYVQSVVGLENTKIRILTNLEAGVTNPKLLDDYLEFIQSHKIEADPNTLLPYIANDHSSASHKVLNTYIALGGDVEKLRPALLRSTSYFRQSLIDKFIHSNSPNILKDVRKLLRNETNADEKMTLTRYLVRLQDKKGVKAYIQYLESIQSSPDDTSPAHPLYSLRSTRFTKLILYLFELSQQPQYRADSFNDLHTISYTTLQYIALHEFNFPKFKKQVKNWITQRKLKKKVVPPNLFDGLYALLENLEKQYYISNVVMLSQSQAIELYQKIH